MKNIKENLKKTVLVIMVAMIALNVRFYRTYAEEEPVSGPETEEVLNLAEENKEVVEMPVAPETENTDTVEENVLTVEVENIEQELEEVNLETKEVSQETSEELPTLTEENVLTEEVENIEQAVEEINLETKEVSQETSEELQTLTEEIAQTQEEIPTVEAEIEEAEKVSNESYTLYNYISLNDGKSYISLNTQENGISAAKTAAEFHKENGNKRYDLSENEYEIADYDLTDLVITTGGFSFVEKSVAKEGQPYFTGRLDRVEAVAAANFRPSDSVEGIESFESLDNSNITFHRNWYLTLSTPMTNNKLLTGVRLGDGKNGNGNGKYYGLEFTEDFQAVDSRFISFGTKLNKDQYNIEDYDFTGVDLEYNGEKYAYRPNGPVAGDGEGFHYYTVDFMKVDKLNKSTYAGGYLAENWPKWALINSNAAGIDGYPYLEGYYHRDYQATLMIGDAPVIIEEEPVVEEIVPVVEETVEEIVEVSEKETVIETEQKIEEVNSEIKNEEMIEASVEETVIEEIAEIVEEKTVAEETVEEVVEVSEKETVIETEQKIEEVNSEIKNEEMIEASVEETVSEETAEVIETEQKIEEVNNEIKNEEMIEASVEETVIEEIAAEENAPVQEAVVSAPVMTVSANTNVPEIHEIKDEVLPQAQTAETVEILIPETVVPQAAPEISEEVSNWALANLISVLASILGMIFTMNRNKNNSSKLLGIIPAALAILFFLLTEDTNGMMVLTDRYTLMMVLFPLVSLLTAWLAGNRKEDNRSDLINSPAI